MMEFGTYSPGGAEIFIDENGDWYHRGIRIFRPEILELLYEKLELLSTGEYVLRTDGEVCPVRVADTPFVVYRVDLDKAGQGEERLALSIRNIDRVEFLDPGTLRIGEDNVLYCRICDGRFPARFSRPAYYQLAGFIQEEREGDGFCVCLNGKEYLIAQ